MFVVTYTCIYVYASVCVKDENEIPVITYNSFEQFRNFYENEYVDLTLSGTKLSECLLLAGFEGSDILLHKAMQPVVDLLEGVSHEDIFLHQPLSY